MFLTQGVGSVSPLLLARLAQAASVVTATRAAAGLGLASGAVYLLRVPEKVQRRSRAAAKAE